MDEHLQGFQSVSHASDRSREDHLWVIGMEAFALPGANHKVNIDGPK